MRFRSAWKKTPVPAPAAPMKATRNCVEESSPTSGHGSGKPRASPSQARSTAVRRQQSNCGHERDPGSTARPAPACGGGAARRAPRRPAARRSPRRRARVGPRHPDRRLGRDGDPRRHRRDARPAHGERPRSRGGAVPAARRPELPAQPADRGRRDQAARGGRRPDRRDRGRLQRFRRSLRKRDRRHTRRPRRRVREAHLLVDDACSPPSRTST